MFAKLKCVIVDVKYYTKMNCMLYLILITNVVCERNQMLFAHLMVGLVGWRGTCSAYEVSDLKTFTEITSWHLQNNELMRISLVILSPDAILVWTVNILNKYWNDIFLTIIHLLLPHFLYFFPLSWSNQNNESQCESLTNEYLCQLMLVLLVFGE